MIRTLLLIFCAFALGAEELRVMSVNVRFANPKDGDNVWENRRDLLVATIRLKSPDLIGTQELFHLQAEYIVQKAPDMRGLASAAEEIKTTSTWVSSIRRTGCESSSPVTSGYRKHPIHQAASLGI